MALKKVLKDKFGDGVQITLGQGDSLLIGPKATIQSTNDAAILALFSNQKITVKGTVVSEDDGMGSESAILLGNSYSDIGMKVVVTRSGEVFSDRSGIEVFGSKVSISNAGLISANDGIELDIAGAGRSVIRNSGLITSDNDAIDISGTQKILVINTGELLAPDGDALSGDDGSVTFVNKGLAHGNIILSSAADVYDGRGGRVFGDIAGGDGNDRFILGKGRENIFGDGDTDTLDFRSGPGVRVSLDGSLNGTGAARNDRYEDVENILGSTFGNDRLRGDINNNVLKGFGGKDTLEGGFGVDELIGGKGKDVLTGGGAGNDSFVFDTFASIGDRITDFGAALGDEDSIQIKASAFGGGLTAGGPVSASQFNVRANSNSAQDNNDRFIYRSSDTTLWFDRDGQGGNGPVLVANLQAGAVLTAADIFLF